MNRERNEQARLAKEAEQKEKMAMADYINKIKVANRNKEEDEMKKRHDWYLTQQKNAMVNLQRHEQEKEKSK